MLINKIRSKKGFTLAELLIVVAIIAVLTAIAVPLFVTQLGKAKEAAFNASLDNLKTAGIIAVLNSDTIKMEELANDDKIYVTGKFEGGNLDTTTIQIELVHKEGSPAHEVQDSKEAKYENWNNGNCTLWTILDVKDVKATSYTPAAV